MLTEPRAGVQLRILKNARGQRRTFFVPSFPYGPVRPIPPIVSPHFTATLSGVLKTFLTVVLIFAILLIECMAGGTRLVFSLPSYCLLAVAALATVARRPDGGARPSLACLIVSALFFTYILVRAALSPVTYLWWTDFYMVLGCLMVYLLTTVYLTGNRERAMVIWALLGLAVIEVFIGLRQFSGGDNWMPFGFIRADSGHRASGMLISSIHLAGYLEAVALFALSYAFWSTWKPWARILAGYIALMSYVGIAITGSRGGYISALCSLVVFTAISLFTVRQARREKFRRNVAITAVTMLAFVAIAIALMSQSELLRKRLSMIPQQLEKNGLDIRVHNWAAALDQFRVSPWLGTGAGTHIYYGRYFRRPPLQSDPIHAHSDYLELLAEYGAVGAIGMAAFLVVHLRRGWRNYRAVLERDLHDLPEYQPARHDSLALYIGALSAISAYLAHSVVDFNLHVPGHALIFAFIFGVVASPVYGAAAAPQRRALFLPRWALPALGLWMIFSSLGKFAGEYWGEKARIAFRNYEFSDSIKFAQESLTFDDRNPEIFFYLGGAQRGSGVFADDTKTRIEYFEAAVEAYQRGLMLFPQDEHTLIRLGETLNALGRFKEAEILFQAAIALDRNLGKVHAYYAWHLATVGRTEEAEERFETAKSLNLGVDNLTTIVRRTSLDPRTQTN